MDLFRRISKKVFATRQYFFNIVPYVLIGGGTASYYASMTIRARDPNARVLIISEEDESPYRRAPLSKELWWYGDAKNSDTISYMSPATSKRRHICYEADGFYLNPDELDQWDHGGVALMCGAKVDKLDADANFIQLEDGRKIEFEKCLISTGSIPLQKYLLENDPELDKNISILGNIDDYRKLHKKLEKMDEKNVASTSGNRCKNIVIFGGDLLGTELAYSLNRRYVRDKKEPNLKIVQITSEKALLTDILPPALSDHSTQILRSQGVEIHANVAIDSMTSTDDKIKIKIKSDTEKSQLLCDHLILAAGAEPRIELAKKSGMAIDNKNGGIIADASMRVKNNVWAAGDVCSFFDEILGYRRRCTHWQHAQITGRIAGENMTNGNKTYTHQGAFVTMLGPTAHICGIGNTDPRKCNTTTIFASNETSPTQSEDELHAIVLYTDNKTEQINGVLLYNVHGFGEEMARKLITDMEPVKNVKEYAKLFELWEIEESSIEKEIDTILEENEIEAYQMRED